MHPWGGLAQEVRIEENLEEAVEVLVEQLEVQITPHLNRGQLPGESRLLVFQVKDKKTDLRWPFSDILEAQLVSEITAETEFVVVSPQKAASLRHSYWRELTQGADYSVALKIAQGAQIPLGLLGTFEQQKDTIRIQLQLIAIPGEDIYASLEVGVATKAIPEAWLTPLSIYQDTKHLEIARAFINEKQWTLAQKALQQVRPGTTPESVEAQGLLIWLKARAGEDITEQFIPFKTLHPQHPLVSHIEQEWKVQLLLKEFQKALEEKAWLSAKDLLQAPLLQQGPPQVIAEHQQLLEQAAILWNYDLIKQKNWQLLRVHWRLLLQVVHSADTSKVVDLQQEINRQFSQELQDYTQRKDRMKAMRLLEEFRMAFLSPDQQLQFREAITAIPLPPPGMVTLPGTTFQMGIAEGNTREMPQHTVTVNAFHLDQYEVTNQDYQRCVAEDQCPPSPLQDDERFQGDRQPVVGVTWQQAQQYCQWNRKRLPTEAEWERAAENGHPLDAYAWYEKNAGNRTRAVGTRKANNYGLYDLLGNALEWVQDYYAEDYYAWSPEDNPQGPASGELKAARGGSWFHPGSGICAQCRYFWSPTLVFNFLGFRCAQSLD